MKVFLSFVLFAAAVFAEPPSFRQQQQNRYFFARQQEEPAPYQASGWRPDGPAFNLPQRAQRQQLEPQQGYGAPEEQQPQQQYGPPQQPENQYGAPQQSQRQQAPPSFRNPQFARQQQPQQGYGTPEQQQPQQQYGPPQQPENQYGAPQQSQRQQAPPSFRNPQFGRQQQPQQGYGAPEQQQPQNNYGPPSESQNQYGPPQQPEYTTTEIPNATEIDEPVTAADLKDRETEQTSEFDDDSDIDDPRSAKQIANTEAERGEYYVALPDGRLQRVRYVSRQDLEAMRYFAKIRAENVEPLRGPIYAYSPLQKLEVAPGNLQISAVAPVAQNTLTITATDAQPQRLVAPKVDIKPIAQLQVQQQPAKVVPLSSSFTTVTQNYATPVQEERYILAFP